MTRDSRPTDQQMTDVIEHDVLILGTGLAGSRAAVEIGRKLGNQVSMGLISKVQVMRPHSVCAEGGTAAVLREEEGDSLDLHAWDTVKGSDFLADQDVVDRFVQACPEEILLLTLDADSTVTVTTSGEEGDTVLYIREDCADPESEVDCSDDGEELGLFSQIEADLDAGTYYIFADTYGSAATFDVLVTVE